MEKIIESIGNWPFVDRLKPVLEGFSLRKELTASGSQYNIFSYCNNNHRSFLAQYDNDTKEFLARIKVGLTQYCDVNYFAGDLPDFERLLAERMGHTLRVLGQFDVNELSSILRENNIVHWDFIAKLPARLAGFELYISPAAPVKIINGSYIIIDYSNFATNSSLLIYYNVFRDDYFGELRVKGLPQMTMLFDSKTLSELQEKLELNLKPVLQSIALPQDN